MSLQISVSSAFLFFIFPLCFFMFFNIICILCLICFVCIWFVWGEGGCGDLFVCVLLWKIENTTLLLEQWVHIKSFNNNQRTYSINTPVHFLLLEPDSQNGGHCLNMGDAWKVMEMRDCPPQWGTSGHPSSQVMCFGCRDYHVTEKESVRIHS